MRRLREAGERQSNVEKQLRESQELLQEANIRLEQMVRSDALTGLGNRRLFDERFRRDWTLSRSVGVPLSLLMIDIDHFKKVNDRAGHLTGDAILRHVATLLASSTRETDTCTRYGGEEFAILLPATSIAKAAELAERLRVKVANTPLAEHAVTISIGVASDDGDLQHLSAAALVERADAALYAAKQAGRNRVACAESLDN
jgi:diguanylate cyclase (GGDEF)-like protein